MSLFIHVLFLTKKHEVFAGVLFCVLLLLWSFFFLFCFVLFCFKEGRGLFWEIYIKRVVYVPAT